MVKIKGKEREVEKKVKSHEEQSPKHCKELLNTGRKKIKIGNKSKQILQQRRCANCKET